MNFVMLHNVNFVFQKFTAFEFLNLNRVNLEVAYE